MHAAATYLLSLLFFAADFAAPEETLKAGIQGYKQKAEAVRKLAIAEADKQAREYASQLAAAKRGKISPALVGSRESSGQFINGAFFFGTETEKAKMVAALSRGAFEWREYAAGLRAKKLFPQVALWLDGATPGATGAFWWGLATISSVDRDSFRIFASTYRVASGPSIEHCESCEPIEFVIEHGGRMVVAKGDKVSLVGLFQFSGTSNGCPVFTRVDDVAIGDVELVFREDGNLLPNLKR